VGHTGVGLRPDKANENGFAVECVPGVELALSVFELANLDRDDETVFAVGPVKVPLVGLRIVRAQVRPSMWPAAPSVSNSSI
jgi:hypothetical protein